MKGIKLNIKKLNNSLKMKTKNNNNNKNVIITFF